MTRSRRSRARTAQEQGGIQHRAWHSPAHRRGQQQQEPLLVFSGEQRAPAAGCPGGSCACERPRRHAVDGWWQRGAHASAPGGVKAIRKMGAFCPSRFLVCGRRSSSFGRPSVLGPQDSVLVTRQAYRVESRNLTNLRRDTVFGRFLDTSNLAKRRLTFSPYGYAEYDAKGPTL